MSPTPTTISNGHWRSEAGRFDDYNYRQMDAYGTALAERQGALVERVAIADGPKLLGLALVRVRPLPVLGGGLAYVSGGPLVRAPDRGEEDAARCFAACLTALRDEYVRRRNMVLRIDPAIGDPGWNERQSRSLKALQFSPSPHRPSRRTIRIALDRPLEDIRASLRQKWRNRLNRAERHGLVITTGTDEGSFAEFVRLFAQFQRAKSFPVTLDAAFYASVQRRLPDPQRLHVALVEADGQPVAGHISSMLGDTSVYLLGATTAAGLQNQASYLLQWHAITTARERRLHWYDLGGIAPDENPGVCHFKRGLGGIEVIAAGPHDLIPAGPRARLTRSAESVYRRLAPAARCVAR